MPWTTADIPDLSGRRVIVTGANSGIGLAATAQLMAHGAAVTMAVRDELKGRAAAALVEDGGSGSIEVAWLDLADLASVRLSELSIQKRIQLLCRLHLHQNNS